MKIKQLRLINFKNFTEEYTFSFQDSNLITGKNGSGKTAIKDAILFCFYNRTSDGSLSESSRHISKDKNKCLVEVIFEKNGQEHTVRRERTNKQTRITYCDNSQSEEDSQITQETLESIVPPYENFQATFNIGWFMALSDKEKRNYILNLTPQVDTGEIFERLGGTHEDIEKFSLLFDNIEDTHKQLLERKRENNHQIEAMRIFNNESIPLEIPKLEYIDKSEELAKIKSEQEKIIHLNYKWSEYNRVKKHNKEVEEKNKSLENRIKEITVLDLEMPTQDKLNLLISQKNEYSKQISLPPETCPTCFQSVAIEHRNKIEKINAENKYNLAEIEKVLLTEQRSFRDVLTVWQENEDNKKKKLMLETQFSDPLPLPEKPEPLSEINDKELQNLEILQKRYIEQKNTIKILTEQEIFRKEKIENNKEKMALLSLENERLLFLINIFSPKGIPAEEMNLKLDPLKKIFQTLLPNSDIITLELLKNEMGYKEVFQITVDGKDYSKLSLGEKTRVDISLSQIINSMLLEKIDIFFLDDAEVLDSSISLPSQSFICKVTNQPLKIN